MFPSTRVSTPSLVDRATLNSTFAVLYDQLYLQATIVGDYHSLKEAYRDQKLRIDRLYVELLSYLEIAPRLATFVQERHLCVWIDSQDTIQRSRQLQTELA